MTAGKTETKSISQIRQELQAADEKMLPFFIEQYKDDTRTGVRKLAGQAAGRLKKYQTERLRLEKMRMYERRYEEKTLICGIDEAGRGPLAGPVAAGAVILPKDCEILYLNDSKKLSEKRREELYNEIMDKAVCAAVGLISPKRIDEINILQATYEAMRLAVSQLDPAPQILLNDAVRIPGIGIPQVPIIKGDAKSVSIAAASILAKVTRDHLMLEYDRIYPEYGFREHKGYGTAAHIAAIRKYGPCPIHRRTFIAKFIEPAFRNKAELPALDETGAGSGASTTSIGKTYEKRAAQWMKQGGMRIRECNFRCDLGEIDIIADDRRTLVFTEVKYRSSDAYGDPAEAVDLNKQRRICLASDVYKKMHRIPQEYPVRYDAAAITGDQIRYIKNAFPYRR